ncbi:MAG: transglycosylase SLT domain-containing protein [Candidatus Saccharibacteria bacterium]
MEMFPDKLRFSRRDVLIGALALTVGVLIESPSHSFFDQTRNMSPLAPENGEAQSTLEIEWLPDTVKRWKTLIEKFSHQYDIDPDLTAIIMTVESGGDPNAQSKYATSLMQITPDRAKDIANNFMKPPRKSYDLKDPATAIEFGVLNIRHLTDKFGNPNQGPAWDKTVGLVAAGYNGGEGVAQQYLDGGLKGLEDNKESHAYVRYVTRMWDERHDDKSFAYRAWLNPLEGNGQALVNNAAKYVKP